MRKLRAITDGIDQSYRYLSYKAIDITSRKLGYNEDERREILIDTLRLNKDYSIVRGVFEPFYHFRKTRAIHKILNEKISKPLKKFDYPIVLVIDTFRLLAYAEILNNTFSKLSG